jgi:hypothetical protein
MRGLPGGSGPLPTTASHRRPTTPQARSLPAPLTQEPLSHRMGASWRHACRLRLIGLPTGRSAPLMDSLTLYWNLLGQRQAFPRPTRKPALLANHPLNGILTWETPSASVKACRAEHQLQMIKPEGSHRLTMTGFMSTDKLHREMTFAEQVRAVALTNVGTEFHSRIPQQTERFAE